MSENFNKNNPEGEQKIRIKFPRSDELLAVIDQRVGGNRMIVKCSDGKKRNARIPGRLRRALWIREGDVVIVKKWEFDEDKCDILFKYNKNLISALKDKGLLNGIDEEF